MRRREGEVQKGVGGVRVYMEIESYLTIIARTGLLVPGSTLISASHSFPQLLLTPSSVPAYSPFPLPSLAPGPF
jgi:hypothetical protein